MFRRLRRTARTPTAVETTPDPLVAASDPEIRRLSHLDGPDAKRLAEALRATASERKDPDQAWTEVRAGLGDSVTADLGRLGLVVLGRSDAGGR